jgi:DNA-binding CsgD family transcriptional regulator
VEPLSRDAVASLAGPYALDAEHLYGLTGGNPFFVTEVLAAGGERLPATVRDAVLARVSRLTEPARELLGAAAIVPGEVELWLLEALGSGEPNALEECLSSGVMTANRVAVSFRHELARVAIEESIIPTRRVALHRRALGALERRNDRKHLARLAYHAEAAGDAHAVLRWAPAAAEQASHGGSHREAAGQCERALRFAELVPTETRTELLKRRANECWLSDQFDAAIEAEHAVLDGMRLLGDRLGEGDALRTLSRLMFFVGRVGEGEALALQAVELLEGLPPSRELALAYGNVSQRRMVVAELEDTLVWGGRALEVAHRVDDTEAVVYARTNIGAAQMQAGLDEGRDELEQALQLALEHGLEDYAGRAFMSIVRCAVESCAYRLAENYVDRAEEYCRERGLDTWRLYLLADRARMDLARGNWDKAADVAALVLRDPRSAPLPRGQALTVLGLVRARRGDPGAAELLEQEREVAGTTDEILRIGLVVAAGAEAAWLAGDAARVERDTDVALGLALGHRVTWVAGELACWRWRAGAREQLPRELVAEPYWLSLTGDWRAAAERWRELGCPYQAALAIADGAEEVALRQALDELQVLGARAAAAIVARRLRERGVYGVPRGPRPRTRENPAGLTARQVEVLRLLAAGLRNAQIAERLVVSEKTVDHHVSAILRKLDVSTRVEAAARASQIGLTTQDR